MLYVAWVVCCVLCMLSVLSVLSVLFMFPLLTVFRVVYCDLCVTYIVCVAYCGLSVMCKCKCVHIGMYMCCRMAACICADMCRYVSVYVLYLSMFRSVYIDVQICRYT